MRLRFVGLVVSVATFSGSVGAMAWFAAQPLGISFALGMAPFAMAGLGLAIYWSARIFRTRVISPGTCECGHIRCVHDDGEGKCHISYGVSEKFPNSSSCACKLFIPPQVTAPQSKAKDSELAELRKLSGL